MNPKVSVVIASYNYGRFLPHAIDSAIAQTYGNVEVVLVDDGSTDETPEVIKPYSQKSLIKYVRIENSGQAVAKNTGIRNATGEFIAFLDADDMWDVSKLERQMLHFTRENVGVVYCSANDIDTEGNFKPKDPITSRYSLPRTGNILKYLVLDNFIPFSSAVVRKTCFEKLGVFDESLKMGIDWDLWLRLSLHYEFVFVDSPLLHYRVGHSDQMSKNVEERQRCSDRIINGFIEAHPDRISRWTIRKAQAFTSCNRGEYYMPIDRGRSIACFLTSIRKNPAGLSGYKGLFRSMCAGQRPGRRM
jgi:glycosyltransferase involved in cell wall biosynthesis